MSDCDDQVTKKKQKVNDDQSAGCGEMFHKKCPQSLLHGTQSTDSNQSTQTMQEIGVIIIETNNDQDTSNSREIVGVRVNSKTAERDRLYRERHREEINQRRRYNRHCKKNSHEIHTLSNIENINQIEQITNTPSNNQQSSNSHTQRQRQQRYYEKNREEINKRKRDRRPQQNVAQAIPATAVERNRNYRERNRQTINQRRRDSRLLQQSSQQKDSLPTENEIKVFCPKCDAEDTAEGIQQDQTKLLIAKVYHYLEQEYEELKIIYGDLDLTPLSKFRQRTALATGVSETTVLQILKEEERRNADKRQEPPETRRRARKRPRQTDSASDEDSSDDNVDDNEQSSYVHEAQVLEVKIEPSEYYNEEPEIYVPAAVKVEPIDVELNEEQAQPDSISLDVKTEPRSDVVDDANETLALNEPGGTKRRTRKIPRSDVTYTRSSLFGDTEIKTEEIEIHQEGFS